MDRGTGFDLQDFLPYVLTLAAEEASLEFQKYYKDTYGMLRAEWRVLFHLGRYGGMTATEICTRARIHKTKVSRAVRALEHRRYLRKETQEHDRRQDMLLLTKQGLDVYSDLSRSARDFNAEITARFSDAENAQLLKTLKLLAKL